MLVNVGEFLYVNGNVAFDLGSRTIVNVNTGIPESLGSFAKDEVQQIK